MLLSEPSAPPSPSPEMRCATRMAALVMPFPSTSKRRPASLTPTRNAIAGLTDERHGLAGRLLPLRRRQRLRRVRGGRLERHGLSSPTPSVGCTPTGELSPMAFLVGVRLRSAPQTPTP